MLVAAVWHNVSAWPVMTVSCSVRGSDAKWRHRHPIAKNAATGARTHNLRLRGPTPYPLSDEASGCFKAIWPALPREGLSWQWCGFGRMVQFGVFGVRGVSKKKLCCPLAMLLPCAWWFFVRNWGGGVLGCGRLCWLGFSNKGCAQYLGCLSCPYLLHPHTISSNLGIRRLGWLLRAGATCRPFSLWPNLLFASTRQANRGAYGGAACVPGRLMHPGQPAAKGGFPATSCISAWGYLDTVWP